MGNHTMLIKSEIFPVMRLPQDIRLRIWKFVLVSEKQPVVLHNHQSTIYEVPRDQPFDSTLYPPYPQNEQPYPVTALLETCRLVRREAAQIYYKQNTFAFKHYEYVAAFLSIINDFGRSLVTSLDLLWGLSLRTRDGFYQGGTTIDSRAKGVGKMLTRCPNLKTLKLTVATECFEYQPPGSVFPEWKIDGIAELRKLRKLPSVSVVRCNRDGLDYPYREESLQVFLQGMGNNPLRLNVPAEERAPRAKLKRKRSQLWPSKSRKRRGGQGWSKRKKREQEEDKQDDEEKVEEQEEEDQDDDEEEEEDE